MSYNELRNALKSFKSQGLTTIALNAKKAILQAEYDRLITESVIDSEPDYSQDCADIYTRTATQVEDIALIELTQVSTDPIEDIAKAHAISPDSGDLFPEKLRSASTMAKAILKTSEEERPQLIEDIKAREKVFDDLAKILTIFVSSLIKVWMIQRRLFNRVSQWVYQISSPFTTDISDLKSRNSKVDLKAFAHWYFSGFAIPQFA